MVWGLELEFRKGQYAIGTFEFRKGQLCIVGAKEKRKDREKSHLTYYFI